MMLYMCVKSLLRLLYRLLFRFEAKGTHYVPAEGGVILCSNHISLLDPAAIGIMLKRRVRFMAKEELFKIPIFGSFLRALGSFPVKRGGVTKETIRTAFHVLHSGEIFGIFPEGTRNKDGNITAKKGAAMIARRSKAVVIPVAVIGQYKLFHQTKVVYGPPIDMSDLLEQSSSALTLATERIMDHIYRIIHEETASS